MSTRSKNHTPKRKLSEAEAEELDSPKRPRNDESPPLTGTLLCRGKSLRGSHFFYNDKASSSSSLHASAPGASDPGLYYGAHHFVLDNAVFTHVSYTKLLQKEKPEGKVKLGDMS